MNLLNEISKLKALKKFTLSYAYITNHCITINMEYGVTNFTIIDLLEKIYYLKDEKSTYYINLRNKYYEALKTKYSEHEIDELLNYVRKC